jgi:hypothetical protein
VATANAGDTIIIQPGEYNEFLTNTVGGTAGNPITFTGVRGPAGEWLTIIDPSTVVSSDWVPAPEIGVGVYKNTNLNFTVGELTINNKRVAFVYSLDDISTYLSQAYETNWTTGLEIMTLPATITVGSRISANIITFWDGLEALFYSSNTTCFLRLRDGSDPNGLNIRAAPNADTIGVASANRPAISLGGSSYVVWSNLNIRGAIGCLVVDGDNNIVVSNRLAGGYARITLAGNANSVLNNDITTDYYGYSNLGAWSAGAGAVYSVREQMYLISKFLMGESQVSSYDYCIGVWGGDNNLISGNLIFQSLGVGISVSGDVTSPIAQTQIISNGIANHTSTGLLLSKGEMLTAVYGNYFVDNGDSALRFHQLNAASETSRIVYIYRNTSWQPDGIANHIFLHGVSDGGAAPQFYTYHNSFSGGDGVMAQNGQLIPTKTMTNSMFINNIFNGLYFKTDDSQWTNSWMGPFAYNLITPPYPGADTPDWFMTNNFVTNQLVWDSTEATDFQLPIGCLAVDSAIDVSQPFTIYGIEFPALPVTGVQKVGSAWDIGAYESPTNGTPVHSGHRPVFVQMNAAVPQSTQAQVNVDFLTAQNQGNANILAIGWNDMTANISEVIDSAGNNYQAAVPTYRGNGMSQAIYYASNIKGGSNTVTVTFSEPAAYVDLRATEYSGLAAQNSFDSGTSATGAGTKADSGVVVTTTINELLFAAGMTTTAFNAAGVGFTRRVITSPNGDVVEDDVTVAPGSYRATAILDSGAWIMQIAAFKAVASVPDSLIPPQITGVAFNNGNFVVSFTTVPQQKYEVQKTEGLGDGSWSSLLANIAGTGGITQVTDTNVLNSPQTFYRVKTRF